MLYYNSMAQTIFKNLIEQTIKNHIHEQTSVFVFPTQTAADLWADRATNPAVTDVTVVAMERFIAWDDFKGKSIRTTQKDKRSVPAVMRTIFAANLISENAANPFFKNIIPPAYAKSANGFMNWLAGLLPSLLLWKEYFEAGQQQGNKVDDEDDDLLLLYKRYKAFLDGHNLFDPAWEKPPFKPDGNHYYIFFPEILSDFTEYQTLLESSPKDISLIHLKEAGENHASADAAPYTPSVDFFSNARTEIKYVCLYLRKLHQKKNIPWDEICISIPDFDSYGPYIDRELSLYQIPHVTRISQPLSSSGAGSLFSQISSSVASDFSYQSLKTLLLNKELPWKDPDLNDSLIQFGQANNCICSFIYKNKKFDVWSESFKDNFPGENVVNYFKSLKRILTDLVTAPKFEKVREHYFNFRETFFNMNDCPPHTDRLISRCIAELGGLIDLERDVSECTVPSPFSFFISQLDNTNYLAQTDISGVQLLPYKAAACAPFSCHVILDSSQASLAVVYKKLSFLSEDKRKRLLGNKDDPNVTDLFLQLYAMNAVGSSESPLFLFTASSKTFSGYAQACSYLIENDYTKIKPALLSNSDDGQASSTNDFYSTEKDFLLSGQVYNDFTPLTLTQKEGFDFWKESHLNITPAPQTALEDLNTQLRKNRMKEGKLRISETHLKKFFSCQRLWFLSYIVDLKEISNEAELMNAFAIGNLYHKILELYCKSLIRGKNGLHVLHLENGELTEPYKKLLTDAIDEAIEVKKNSYLARQLLQTTKQEITETITNTVIVFSNKFEGHTVAGSELKLEYAIPDTDILCEGTVDCLLQDPSDGHFILVDFKTSDGAIPKNLYYKPPEPGQKEELPDFQMPLYIYLLQNQSKPISVDECYFFDVTKATPKPVDLAELAPSQEKTFDCIKLYAQELLSGDFLNKSVSDFNQCNGCTYRAICRKVFTVGRLQ